MYIEIKDYDHAAELVSEGDITHTWVADSSSAQLLLEAFKSRLESLCFASFTSSVKLESEFLRSEIANLKCEYYL